MLLKYTISIGLLGHFATCGISKQATKLVNLYAKHDWEKDGRRKTEKAK